MKIRKMHHLPREAIEKAFVGKICYAVHPVSVRPSDCFWVRPVFIREPDYQPNRDTNIIDEFKLKGSKDIWWTKGVIPLDIKPNERLLVIDIVRNVMGRKPTWDAIVLYGEKTYSFSLEALVLDD